MLQKSRLDFDEIIKIINGPLKPGEFWYLLDKNWYDTCRAQHEKGDGNPDPGPIDNSALFEPLPESNLSTKNRTALKSSNGFSSSSSNNLADATAATSTTTTTTTSTTTTSISASNATSTTSETRFGTQDAEAVSADSRPLRSDLSEADGHFILVPEKCWNLLKNTYGIVSPNHAIKRRVIELQPGENIVEINPVRLNLCLYGGKESNVERCFSRVTPLDELQQEMRKMFNVSAEREAKLWINSVPYIFKPEVPSPAKSENNLQSTSSPLQPPPTPPPMPNTNASSSNNNSIASPTVVTRQAAKSMNKPIALPDSTTSPNRSLSLSTSASDSPISSSSRENPSNQTLMSVGVSETAVATLEVTNADGTWPSSRPSFGAVATRSAKAQPGLCGLSNMGNTCFMNAALQCLSNTPPLTNYILADKFVDDVNVNNPLGMRGEIARTYTELIKIMWSGNYTSFLPREFKCAVSRFAPRFNGFLQQDCQELMAFLLDGLHEDLNRIRNKPYIEIKNDVESRPDEIVAEESWSNYKKRNDSIVVDTFHGMLKSTLVCPGCELVSVTFDPFCYLSLPLPVKRDKRVLSQITPPVASSTGDDARPKKSADAMDEDEPSIPTKEPALQLKDCISQFLSVERLGADDPWYCPKCKQHQQATKKFDIWSLPKVLIIHLKRFSFSRSWRDKIDTLVEFPVDNLDMSKYVLNHNTGKPLTYNLIGVANHFGGLGRGHYTAYAKNAPLNAWYSFDDSLVSTARPSNVVTQSAYVLFYQLQEENQQQG